ncbi:hypothetical protein VP01_1685g2 [Puccinia sorghi]|uniref:Uncharacterized protein n=1 Tax=Puccinia sorghi TaxID=27349 RepID=A0A0L6VFX3_9BASI|nr:hypothetical protein VP01_1685g2 [Puccinia sorghi]
MFPMCKIICELFLSPGNSQYIPKELPFVSTHTKLVDKGDWKLPNSSITLKKTRKSKQGKTAHAVIESRYRLKMYTDEHQGKQNRKAPLSSPFYLPPVIQTSVWHYKLIPVSLSLSFFVTRELLYMIIPATPYPLLFPENTCSPGPMIFVALVARGILFLASQVEIWKFEVRPEFCCHSPDPKQCVHVAFVFGMVIVKPFNHLNQIHCESCKNKLELITRKISPKEQKREISGKWKLKISMCQLNPSGQGRDTGATSQKRNEGSALKRMINKRLCFLAEHILYRDRIPTLESSFQPIFSCSSETSESNELIFFINKCMWEENANQNEHNRFGSYWKFIAILLFIHFQYPTNDNNTSCPKNQLMIYSDALLPRKYRKTNHIPALYCLVLWIEKVAGHQLYLQTCMSLGESHTVPYLFGIRRFTAFHLSIPITTQPANKYYESGLASRAVVPSQHYLLEPTNLVNFYWTQRLVDDLITKFLTTRDKLVFHSHNHGTHKKLKGNVKFSGSFMVIVTYNVHFWTHCHKKLAMFRGKKYWRNTRRGRITTKMPRCLGTNGKI